MSLISYLLHMGYRFRVLYIYSCRVRVWLRAKELILG